MIPSDAVKDAEGVNLHLKHKLELGIEFIAYAIIIYLISIGKIC